MVVSAGIDFRIENARRISFKAKKWSVSPDELAAAGFFYYPISVHKLHGVSCQCVRKLIKTYSPSVYEYYGCEYKGYDYKITIDDRVRCFRCGLQLVEWKEGDKPAVEHKRWSPLCEFISSIVDNVPAVEWSPSRDYIRRIQSDISNLKEDKYHREKMPVVVADFSIENVRLKSFENWPVPFISPTNLAKSGFYYCPVGYDVCGNMEPPIDDRVRCFFCGIELIKWEIGDEPNEEHRKWSPSCEFVQKLFSVGPDGDPER